MIILQKCAAGLFFVPQILILMLRSRAVCAYSHKQVRLGEGCRYFLHQIQHILYLPTKKGIRLQICFGFIWQRYLWAVWEATPHVPPLFYCCSRLTNSSFRRQFVTPLRKHHHQQDNTCCVNTQQNKQTRKMLSPLNKPKKGGKKCMHSLHTGSLLFLLFQVFPPF